MNIKDNFPNNEFNKNFSINSFVDSTDHQSFPIPGNLTSNSLLLAGFLTSPEK
ncbi:conserved hypothetical protein [Bacteroides helcogenes P 36-108]|uniref:Uncharacterized protein n=1 Tax=Bacteroides helcogenes (strain ATCC 35417 / DSM 20613 / JCM 6297 / CCUG 15421 / P 36-108) TaxID=693979 RepID=E6SSW1_BACT6|nr:conserved hypothetical protein [Bacteroides helcogenes P 36-108]